MVTTGGVLRAGESADRNGRATKRANEDQAESFGAGVVGGGSGGEGAVGGGVVAVGVGSDSRSRSEATS
ncbi:hypothetical protein, partial [Streptomyces griseolus]|uniref:hypothetical protein n=1 Tax=Streptomyces griseolus TaxID=1909 RepID=UPI002243C800